MRPPCDPGRKVAAGLAAYQGTKIVGSIFSIPCSLRIGSAVRTVPIITGFAVDPDHRRAAVPLVERIRRLHAEREIAFGIGGFGGSRSSASRLQFLDEILARISAEISFLFQTGHWFDTGPRRHGAGQHHPWERLASNTLATC